MVVRAVSLKYVGRPASPCAPCCSSSDRVSETPGGAFSGQMPHRPDINGAKWDISEEKNRNRLRRSHYGELPPVSPVRQAVDERGRDHGSRTPG